jgi:hypothetical protein
MGHASPFQTYKFQELFNDIRNSSIQWVCDPCNRSLNIWESNSQNGNSLGNVRVHSLTLSYTPGSMRYDSRASFLARILAGPCLGRKPKARVATTRHVHILNCFFVLLFMFSFATIDNLSYVYSFASITIFHLLNQLSMVSHSFSLNTLSIVMHYHINSYKYCCCDTYIT